MYVNVCVMYFPIIICFFFSFLSVCVCVCVCVCSYFCMCVHTHTGKDIKRDPERGGREGLYVYSLD